MFTRSSQARRSALLVTPWVNIARYPSCSSTTVSHCWEETSMAMYTCGTWSPEGSYTVSFIRVSLRTFRSVIAIVSHCVL